MDFGTPIGALRASQPYVRDLIIKMLQDPENFSHLGDLAIKRWEDAEPFYGDSSLAKTEEELIVGNLRRRWRMPSTTEGWSTSNRTR